MTDGNVNEATGVRTDQREPGSGAASGYDERLRSMLKEAHQLSDLATQRRLSNTKRLSVDDAIKYRDDERALQAFIAALSS